MDYALGKAEERGEQSGISKSKIEIARKSLEQGIDKDTISVITGLSIEEINDLKKI